MKNNKTQNIGYPFLGERQSPEKIISHSWPYGIGTWEHVLSKTAYLLWTKDHWVPPFSKINGRIYLSFISLFQPNVLWVMRTPYRTLTQEESHETYEILMCDWSHVLVELLLSFSSILNIQGLMYFVWTKKGQIISDRSCTNIYYFQLIITLLRSYTWHLLGFSKMYILWYKVRREP